MSRHYRLECVDLPRFKCPHCDMRSKYTQAVYRHIRAKHRNMELRARSSFRRPLQPYDTDVLGALAANMEYRERRNAAKHEDDTSFWHTGKMSYHCPRCNAGYTYKKTLKTHLKYDCGKEPRFKCPYCNKRDKCSSNIYKHVRMRHDGMPVIVHRN
ncbi:unnamed protein product [Xylocopa violacea]|uniref:C2H2-type domain-containing protein n=1 Tax=Xylocopa violacea TaxID=135666 RepID=A0ABP1NG04_XYLVO